MTEIASLQLEIDTSSIDRTRASLADLTQSGERTDAAILALVRSSREAMSGVHGLGGGIDETARRMDVLRASIDPAYAGQKRLNEELSGTPRLFRLVAGETNELIRATVTLTGITADRAKSQTAASEAMTKAAKAAGLEKGEIHSLGKVFLDFAGALASGKNPLDALIEQGPKLADVFLSAAGRGVTLQGAVGSIVAEAAPFAGAIGVFGAIAAPLAVGAAAALDYSKALHEAQFATGGLGRASGLTVDQFMALAANAAAAGDVSVKAARDGEAAYVHAGIANKDVLTGLIGVQRAYAEVTGQSAKDANAALAASFADPINGVATLDSQLNFLDATTKQHIIDLAKQNDLEGAQALMLKALKGDLADATDKVGGLSAAWHSVTVWASNAWDAMGHALTPGLDDRIRQQKAILETMKRGGVASKHAIDIQQSRLDALQMQKATDERNAADRAATAKARTKSKQDAAAADAKAAQPPTPPKPVTYTPPRSGSAAGASPADRLREEAAAQMAAIKGNIALADAYRVSEAAAIRQMAVTKALTDKIKAGADTAIYVDRQLRLSVSEAEVVGAKSYRAMIDQTEARKRLNAEVAGGQITLAEANQKLRDEAALRDLNLAKATAELMVKDAEASKDKDRDARLKAAKAALAEVNKLIDDTTTAQKDANATEAEAQRLSVKADQEKQIETLKAQLGLVTATNEQRAVELAMLAQKQAILARGGNADTPQAIAEILRAGDAARLTSDLQVTQDNYNASLNYTTELLAQIDGQARDAAQSLETAFSNSSDAIKGLIKGIGGVVTALTGLASKEASIAAKRKSDIEKARVSDRASDEAKAISAQRIAQIETLSANEALAARVDAYAGMADAASSFFDQNSAGFRILHAAEAGFRAFQLAMSIRAMMQKTAETTLQIASDHAGLASHTAVAVEHEALHLAVAQTGAAAGAGRIFGELGPLGFPVVAAMLAVMASLGFSGGAGAAVPGEHDAEKRQKAQGAGSVLGDAEAKSESIKKSLDLVADHTNTMLEFYNPMLSALRSIDSQIGTLASALARSLGVGGMLSAEGLGLGTTISGGQGLAKFVLPFHGFGTKITKTLQDQGLQFSAGSLGSILSGGVQGKTYAQILTETKKSFFGLTYSDRFAKKTALGALDPEFARQTTLLIGSLRDGVVAAASTLGIEGAAATLDAFELDLGKISLKGLKGEEITKALEAVFGKAADQMAAAVMPGLETFQKVGEGAFETLTRLARDYQVVDVTLKSIGKVFGAVGVASVTARERLVELSGGLDNFTDQASFYAENFLSEAERLAPIQDAVAAELARLGLTGVKTRDQFKAVVQGLDVSTEAGTQLYAALMTLAPAFAAVTEESQALSDAKDTLSAAYERERGALQDTHDRFADLAKSLHDFGTSLYNGPAAALSPEAQYRAAQAAFQQTAGLAAQGNEQALGDLQNVSQAYLDASKAYYASSEGYFADLAAVRDAVAGAEVSAGAQADVAQQQLEAMTAQVSQLIELNTHVVTVAEAIAALNLLLGGGGGSGAAAASPSSMASNDNTAQVVGAIRDLQTEVAGVTDQLAADKGQRAAIAQQQDARLAAVEDQLAALRRAAQA